MLSDLNQTIENTMRLFDLASKKDVTPEETYHALKNGLVILYQKQVASGGMPIHVAAAAGNIALVMQMLLLDPRLLFVKNTQNGMYPLHLACKYNHTSLVAYMLCSTLKLGNTYVEKLLCTIDIEGNNAFDFAFKQGHIGLYKDLLPSYKKILPKQLYEQGMIQHLATEIALKRTKFAEVLIGEIGLSGIDITKFVRDYLIHLTDTTQEKILQSVNSSHKKKLVSDQQMKALQEALTTYNSSLRRANNTRSDARAVKGYYSFFANGEQTRSTPNEPTVSTTTATVEMRCVPNPIIGAQTHLAMNVQENFSL